MPQQPDINLEKLMEALRFPPHGERPTIEIHGGTEAWKHFGGTMKQLSPKYQAMADKHFKQNRNIDPTYPYIYSRGYHQRMLECTIETLKKPHEEIIEADGKKNECL